MFNRKRKFLEKTQPMFVGPSDWVCEMLRESLLGYDRPVRRVLNIVDPAYRFDATLLWPHKEFTVIFGAFNGRSSPYKGWADLEAALRLLPEEVRRETRVDVFGESAADYEIDGVQIRFLGPINDPEKLRALHHAADVLALPSRQDNAPQVKFEALLDGLPVLAFERTGCAEYIRHNENGWIAPNGDIADYAKGIEFFYRMWRRGELDPIRGKIAEMAKVEFSEAEIVRKMVAVYERCLSSDRK